MDRRTFGLTAVGSLLAGALACPLLAQTAGTLDEVKKRGSLRVGVTQAPPWYSKDPATGEWSSGVGVTIGRTMAAKLGVKFEPVAVT
jgi:polar amino acid transport system substrate-binding protein